MRIDAPDQVIQVFVDDIQIQQILVNLVKNGMDAIAESGRPDGQIDIVIKLGPAELSISVLDNGPGIPEQIRQHLFTPFYTSKAKGVGLGLSICKHIATAHGGSLTFDPPASGLTRFTLKLPRSSIG